MSEPRVFNGETVSVDSSCIFLTPGFKDASIACKYTSVEGFGNFMNWLSLAANRRESDWKMPPDCDVGAMFLAAVAGILTSQYLDCLRDRVLLPIVTAKSIAMRLDLLRAFRCVHQ